MHSCQQDELYASERKAMKGRVFQNQQEMQSFVDSLRDSVYWQTHYPNVLRVEVHTVPSSARGSVGAFFPELKAGQIEMHPVHWCEQYVLHELAHVLANARYGSHAHCPYFASVYLELVSTYMGSDAYRVLYACFTEDKIDYDVEPSLPMWIHQMGPGPSENHS